MNAKDIVDKLLEDGNVDQELISLVNRWVTDAADSTEVLATLQKLGVISPEEATHEDTHVEPGSKEHGAIHVFLYSPKRQILGVYDDGSIERQD